LGNSHLDQSEKEDISPILSFQSPGTTKYQSVPIGKVTTKDGKVLSGRIQNKVDHKRSRQSIGGGNADGFATAIQFYAEEPQLKMIGDTSIIVEDAPHDVNY
jgi:hypothetical protein